MHNRITTTQHDRFIKGLTMALHNEELLSRLSDSEISLYKFILDNRGYLESYSTHFFGVYKTWWRFSNTIPLLYEIINYEF